MRHYTSRAGAAASRSRRRWRGGRRPSWIWRVLVPSRFVAAQLLAHGIAAEKVAVIPYGVDLRAFHPPEKPRDRHGSLECLYVGQISHRKGIPVLLTAAQRCLELPVRFRLFGPIVSPEVLDALPENVRYEGTALPGSGVAEAMWRADFFVVPALEDACTLVILEAMATGLPVIVSKQCGCASCLVLHGENGFLFDAFHVEELAELLVWMHDHESDLEAMGARSRALIEKYSPAEFARKVRILYEARLKAELVSS